MKSYRWAPFIPVSADSSMLCVLLLLSKYRLRNVPVVERGEPCITNYITQSAVIKGLERCKGRDWFDSISAHPITELGLPFMSSDEVTYPWKLQIYVLIATSYLCFDCLRWEF